MLIQILFFIVSEVVSWAEQTIATTVGVASFTSRMLLHGRIAAYTDICRRDNVVGYTGCAILGIASVFFALGQQIAQKHL